MRIFSTSVPKMSKAFRERSNLQPKVTSDPRWAGWGRGAWESKNGRPDLFWRDFSRKWLRHCDKHVTWGHPRRPPRLPLNGVPHTLALTSMSRRGSCWTNVRFLCCTGRRSGRQHKRRQKRPVCLDLLDFSASHLCCQCGSCNLVLSHRHPPPFLNTLTQGEILPKQWDVAVRNYHQR